MRYLQWLFTASIFLLSGCISLGPNSGPAQTYILNKVNPNCIRANKTSAVLLVTQPVPAPAYSGPQMAYTLKCYQINYFANNRWVEPPNRMLQPLIVKSLQNTGHFKAVVSTPYVGSYQWRLDTELVELRQYFMECPSKVHLVVRARLLNAQGILIAAKEFDICESACAENPYGGAIAANEAVSRMLYRLSVFVIEHT